MVLGVIPARFASTRLPGKPLVSVHGRPLVYWVWARARRIAGVDRLVVATDDERIARVVREFGGAAEMTRGDHPSGSDRALEVADRVSPRPDLVLNLQGDEPCLPVAATSELIAAALRQPDAIWTLAEPIAAREEIERPSVVKVVCAADGRALYFSRSTVPHGAVLALRHLGVYVYPMELLGRFVALGPSPLERIERLEQLRALEAGITLRVLSVPASRSTAERAGIDTPGDLERLVRSYPTADALAQAED